MQDFIFPLVLAGTMAGLVNFYVNYINLPFSKPGSAFLGLPQNLKDIWWVALIGYVVVGCSGAFLTPMIYAISGSGLRGLEWVMIEGVPKPKDANYSYILFGYGLVFGYSTTRILISLSDSLIKKIGEIEVRLDRLDAVLGDDPLNRNPLAANIIAACNNNFEQYKSDCSGFVKAVAALFSVSLTGQADNIVDEIKGAGWTSIANGPDAKAKADSGWLVIAGLKGADNVPAQNNGHVVVVVSGPIAAQKYPSAYWGKLGGVGEKNKTLNYAWNVDSRDKVIYAGRPV